MGSKEFVQEVFDQIKHLLVSKMNRHLLSAGQMGQVEHIR